MKRHRVDLRVSDYEKELWERAAGVAGLSLSELIRRAASQQAQSLLSNVQVEAGEPGFRAHASGITSTST